MVETKVVSIDAEQATAQHRHSDVAAGIGRRLLFLRDPAFTALGSVKLDLRNHEDEPKLLREWIASLDAYPGPLAEVFAVAVAVLRNWLGLDATLREATPDEHRAVLQHLVEVVEIRPDDGDGRKGEYTLGYLPGANGTTRPSADEENKRLVLTVLVNENPAVLGAEAREAWGQARAKDLTALEYILMREGGIVFRPRGRRIRLDVRAGRDHVLSLAHA